MYVESCKNTRKLHFCPFFFACISTCRLAVNYNHRPEAKRGKSFFTSWGDVLVQHWSLWAKRNTLMFASFHSLWDRETTMRANSWQWVTVSGEKANNEISLHQSLCPVPPSLLPPALTFLHFLFPWEEMRRMEIKTRIHTHTHTPPLTTCSNTCQSLPGPTGVFSSSAARGWNRVCRDIGAYYSWLIGSWPRGQGGGLSADLFYTQE